MHGPRLWTGYRCFEEPLRSVVAGGGLIMEKSLGASEVAKDRLEPWTPKALSILRIATGLLFLEHGTQKLLGFPPSEHAFPPLFSLMGIQGALELVGGFLIVIGLLTRPVAFILTGDMAVAYFMAHAPKSFFPTINGGQLAILFCFVFLYLVFAGGGQWSADERLARSRAR